MRLDLDQLQVTSFDTQAPQAAQPAAFSGGEDCFTPMSVCCTHTTVTG